MYTYIPIGNTRFCILTIYIVNIQKRLLHATVEHVT